MKIRLHEIELGSANVQKTSGLFQQIFGIKPAVEQEGLTVFDAGLQDLDFNLSNHVAPGVTLVSFLTDDLTTIEHHLQLTGIAYEGPLPSHLAMSCIQFKSPDGFVIKANMPESSSPERLRYKDCN